MTEHGPIQTRIERLEQAIEGVLTESARCVQELVPDDSARYLVMERLPRLGSAAIPSLRQLASSTTDDEVRVMAALVALEVGDLSLTDILLAEIEANRSLAPLAARRVAAKRVAGAAAAITKALAKANVDNEIDEIVSYLDALRQFEVSLPSDERHRLESGPWQVRSALNEWFRAD